MNKKLTLEIAAFFCILVMLGMTACVKDSCKTRHTYVYYEPVYKPREEVTANIKSNPAKEVENPGKIYVKGHYLFLNEVDKGIHIFDNTNPSSPRNIAFVDIPGNMDLAVKGDILYADMYSSLVALDISDPANVKQKKIVDDVFPERSWGGSFMLNGKNMIVDWVKKETEVEENCDAQPIVLENTPNRFFAASKANAAISASPIGTGGSMARFTIINDYLYAVDYHSLKSISISNPIDPVMKNTVYAGWDIETIYPFQDKLFLGSMGGMFIYDISSPDNPQQQSTFVHARACDPVITDGDYAYITLRAGTNCGPSSDELQVVDISNIQSPVLLKAYPMSGPYGLGKDGDLLFICDGKAGLELYDATDVRDIKLLDKVGDIDTYDVIPVNKNAIVVAKDGLYQYSYQNPRNLRLLSRIDVQRKP